MNKIISIVVLVLLAIAAVFLFSSVIRGVGKCKSFNETECKKKLVCKPFYEYGLHCDEDGCKEGERFKECTSRF